jgi:hypothetical protein
LEGFDTQFGIEHFHTVTTVHNLAKLYTSLGRLDDARNMFERALHARLRRPWDPAIHQQLVVFKKSKKVVVR